jgi:hypothetical protein
MPPVRCLPCRVRVGETRYTISADGTVRPILLAEAGADGRTTYVHAPALDAAAALLIRREAARLRRNRNARERADALRSLGMTCCKDGSWE